jgi:hypothetical protein
MSIRCMEALAKLPWGFHRLCSDKLNKTQYNINNINKILDNYDNYAILTKDN